MAMTFLAVRAKSCDNVPSPAPRSAMIGKILEKMREEPLVKTPQSISTGLESSLIFTQNELNSLDKEYQKLPSIDDLFSNVQSAHQALAEPHEKLADAMGHGVGMVARAAAVGAGSVLAGVPAGVAMSVGAVAAPLADTRALAGGFIGAAAGSVAGSLVGNPFLGTVVGGTLGAGAGRIISDEFRDDMSQSEREISAHNAAGMGAVASMGGGIGLLNAANTPGANPLTYAMAGAATSTFSVTAMLAIPFSFAGMRLLGIAAANYFRPGDALQRGREAFSRWRNDQAKAPEVLKSLQQAQRNSQELKTSLTTFFENLRETWRSADSSSSSNASSVLEKKIKTLNVVEAVLIKEVDDALQGVNTLTISLQEAIDQQNLQKEEHAKWKGVGQSETVGPQYRRPGLP